MDWRTIRFQVRRGQDHHWGDGTITDDLLNVDPPCIVFWISESAINSKSINHKSICASK